MDASKQNDAGVVTTPSSQGAIASAGVLTVETPDFAGRLMIVFQQLFDSIRIITLRLNRGGINTITSQGVEIAVNIISRLSKETLIDNFIDRSIHHWNGIVDVGINYEEVLTANAKTIFSGLPIPGDKIDEICKIFSLKDATGKAYISDEEKRNLHAYFLTMIKVAVKYINVRQKQNYSVYSSIPVSNWVTKLKIVDVNK
jgi:hypothetical protein